MQQEGMVCEQDLTYNLTFMMGYIHDIGTSIYENYLFLPDDHKMYLFVANADRYGKIKVEKEYSSILREKYNTI